MKCEEKKLYITEHEAILGKLRTERKRKVRLRVYNCDKCKGWHLTSHLLIWQSQKLYL